MKNLGAVAWIFGVLASASVGFAFVLYLEREDQIAEIRELNVQITAKEYKIEQLEQKWGEAEAKVHLLELSHTTDKALIEKQRKKLEEQEKLFQEGMKSIQKVREGCPAELSKATYLIERIKIKWKGDKELLAYCKKDLNELRGAF